MSNLPFCKWIANANAGLSGQYGDVTRQAQQAGCSRQTVYDHTNKVVAALEAEHTDQPTREQLLAENQHLRAENAACNQLLNESVSIPTETRQKFVATASAMGLSLTQIFCLLSIILGPCYCPSRSTIHRWTQIYSQAASRVLVSLDLACRPLVGIACIDEIFFARKPVLVAVEPASMVWILGHHAPDRTAETWAKHLRPWPQIQAIVADAGSGLQSAVAQIQQEQTDAGKAPLDNCLDVYHTKAEGEKALASEFKSLEAAWDQAERTKAPADWQRVIEMFQDYEIREQAWKQIGAALQLFRPDGQLNDRTWAAAQINEAIKQLAGECWDKTVRLLRRKETLTFLDRMHRLLNGAIPCPELRQSLLRLWWLRHRQNIQDPTIKAMELVQRMVCQKLQANWVEEYQKLAKVMAETVRASSAVECMNSVIRMGQSTHKTPNQGLMDLQRLHWNCHEFRQGKRRKTNPYRLLGLKLESYEFWDLIKIGMEMEAA